MSAVGIGSALLALTAAINTACVVAYGWTTRGGWRDSEMGRHLMCFMCSEAAILDLSVVRMVAGGAGWPDPVWFRVLRLVVFVTLPVVMGWRLAIIVRAYRGLLERS